MVSQNAAVQAERARRLAWEQEQEAHNAQREAELQSQLAEMRSELLLLKASVSIQQQPGPPLLNEPLPEAFQPPLPEPAAYIEEIHTPMLQEQRVPRTQPAQTSSASNYLTPPIPPFIEGSSTIFSPTLGASEPTTYNSPPCNAYNPMLPSPTLTDATTEQSSLSPLPPPHAQFHQPTASSSTNSPANIPPPPTSSTPSAAFPSPAQSTYTSPIMPASRPHTPSPRALGKRRSPPSPASDYSTEDSDDDSAAEQLGQPRKRKNGHDRRCLTIQVF